MSLCNYFIIIYFNYLLLFLLFYYLLLFILNSRVLVINDIKYSVNSFKRVREVSNISPIVFLTLNNDPLNFL